MTPTTLIINEELKTLLPPLSAEEFAGLEADILEHGCLAPMIVWNGILVDGHHRYEICTKHEIPFSVQNIVFENLDAAKFWAWKHQEHRRNLMPFHRAELALKLKDVIAAKAKERQKGGQGGVLLPQLVAEGKETRRELAEIAQMSHTTLDRAEYIAEHADEETKGKLRRGEKGVSITGEYKRLREEEMQETGEICAEPADNDTDPNPPCPGAKEQTEPNLEACYPQTIPGTKKEDTTNEVTSFHDQKPGFAPGSEVELKYSSKTQLKPIPRNRPDILVRNLLSHFPKEFVPNMIRATFEILVEVGEKKQAKALAQEIYQAFGRK